VRVKLIILCLILLMINIKPIGKPVVPITKNSKTSLEPPKVIPTRILPPPAMTYTYGGAKEATKKTFNPPWIDASGTIAPIGSNQKPATVPVPAIPSQTTKDNALLSRDIASKNPEWGGFYTADNKTSFTRTTRAVKHEDAHHMDDVLGYPSRSMEFRNVLFKYPMFTPIIQNLRKFYSEEEIPQEMYANLFEIYNNNVEDMPEPLRVFFSKEWNIGSR
jgi:hypothetical protein